MTLTFLNLVYGALIVSIVGFCFWQPRFPQALAKRCRIEHPKAIQVFLVVYWITVPVILHRLMSLMWQS